MCIYTYGGDREADSTVSILTCLVQLTRLQSNWRGHAERAGPQLQCLWHDVSPPIVTPKMPTLSGLLGKYGEFPARISDNCEHG